MKSRRSSYYIPFRKDSEFSDSIADMIKGGFIHQESSGIFVWLNLGLKVIEKICKIIDEEHEKVNAIKILMPILHNVDLWKKSKRYDSFGSEMLKIFDRNEKEYIYGPSAEELITNLMTKLSFSKKDLPLNLYNIQWKFRDEIRPRHATVRSREFLMKDAYSFHLTKECLMKTYENMFEVYSKIFNRLNLNVCTLNSDVGLMGGFLSHEFLTKSKYGETKIDFNKWPDQPIKFSECDNVFEDKNKQETYAEIGHIYALGDKYSSVFKLNNNENNSPLLMGCYGIGITRLITILFEKEDLGCVAPFEKTLCLIGNSEKCIEMANKIYNYYDDIIFDDRTDISVGSKFAEADLIKSPIRIFIGEKEAASNQVLVKQNGEKKLINFDNFFNLYQ